MKKTIKIINIFLRCFILLVLGTIIYITININTQNNKNNNIFGYHSYIVLSNSMNDTFIAGDLIFSKEIDFYELKEGDIISFISRDEINKGEIITHKIREIIYDEKPYIITYGTNTNINDHSYVYKDDIIGKYIFKIPSIGLGMSFIKTKVGLIITFIFIFFIIMVINLIKNYHKLLIIKKKIIKGEELDN